MLNKFPRMTIWLLITLTLILFITLISPDKLLLSLYKLSLITMAGVVGFGLDVSLFPYARPDGYLNALDWRKELKKQCDADFSIVTGYEHVFAAAMQRRAIIVGAAMIAAALGA